MTPDTAGPNEPARQSTEPIYRVQLGQGRAGDTRTYFSDFFDVDPVGLESFWCAGSPSRARFAALSAICCRTRSISRRRASVVPHEAQIERVEDQDPRLTDGDRRRTASAGLN